jgi:hypothetical protein
VPRSGTGPHRRSKCSNCRRRSNRERRPTNRSSNSKEELRNKGLTLSPPIPSPRDRRNRRASRRHATRRASRHRATRPRRRAIHHRRRASRRHVGQTQERPRAAQHTRTKQQKMNATF